ncbi:MAG: hypothetical protein RBT76_12925 [candidate division Zixibacteria bacterium]|jgi:hypothetical protein|nr:hypothetical protein [candidate division Zixibacteria bacterium]
MRYYRLTFSMAAVLLLGAGCVKIETSSGDSEQRTHLSAQSAADLRADWARSLQNATPTETAQMLARKIDAVSSAYAAYSLQVAEQWRDGNNTKGEPIPASDMRRYVQGWVATERPLLDANDDMIEYAFARIKEQGGLDDETVEIARRLIASYYELYSAVFIPNGDVTDYEYTVGQRRSDVENLVGELERDLARYF